MKRGPTFVMFILMVLSVKALVAETNKPAPMVNESSTSFIKYTSPGKYRIEVYLNKRRDV